MRMKGARILLEALRREGVEVIFGYPGGAVLDIYHELPEYPIRHILVRHEQAAVHAADGYARASGRVGVALVTSGPGATNTVTGVATAYMDSVPIVVFTGQVPTALIGNDAFQEADIIGITRPCTKHSYLVRRTEDLARIVREAFFIARSGRPGPVLVDLPKNVIGGEAEFVWPERVELRGYRPVYRGHERQIRRALELILRAERPLIYAGGGVISSGASQELLAFAHRLCIPVTLTLMGLGGFPGTDELFLGMLGMHGTYQANMAVSHCDLLIAIGARFDDRATGRVEEFAPHARIIHVDIDPSSISKNVQVDVPIVGDARLILMRLNELVQEEDEESWRERRRPWLEEIERWRRTYPLGYVQDERVVKPQFVVEKLYELTRGEAIIATEVGQNQMWVAQFYRFVRPRSLLTSGGLGTMGYGFPAAIGAQVAFPDALVVDVAGDGSIQMNIQELATVRQHGLPVKVVILNNSYLGMVRQWQELFYGRRYSESSMEVQPDFVKLAEAYGIRGYRVERPQEVEPVLREALGHREPALVDVRVAPEEKVYPMVPAGGSLREMLLV